MEKVTFLNDRLLFQDPFYEMGPQQVETVPFQDWCMKWIRIDHLTPVVIL